MRICIRYKKIIVFFLFLLSWNIVFANNTNSVEFFASNNTNIIDLQTAYNRLNGNEQSALQNSIIHILQKNHVEQGIFEDILGTYQMSDGKMTADNTEHFITSSYQKLPNEKIFSIAQDLAIQLNQDSIAVLIPDDSHLGEITVTFNSYQPHINELTNKIHDTLPEQYKKAFSLHLVKQCGSIADAKVAEVTWLGNMIHTDAIQKTFSSEKINLRYGKAYLIYKDGRIEQL